MRYCYPIFFSWILVGVLFLADGLQAQETLDEEEIYDAIRLEVLCRAMEFSLNQESGKNVSNALDCQSLDALEATIPEEFKNTLRIMRTFKDKRYASYGKNKLPKRLDKLIKDIETELLRLKKNDVIWQESVKVLVVELQTLKDERLNNGIQKPLANTNNAEPIENTETDTQKPQTAMILYIIIIILIGATAFAIFQNMQLKKQLEIFQDELLEKYSRIDNRIDTMTPIKDYKGLILKINYINEQIAYITEQINILHNRNALKMTPEELFAKRTEHLEQHHYNPDVQIYYAKPDPQSRSFKLHDFRTEPTKEFFFKIEIDLESPQQATYSVVNRDEYHDWALQNPAIALYPFCELANNHNNPERIINLEAGYLEKYNKEWKILKKLKISLE